MIELLIVVAIIAILAGMLLPALNRARNKAQAISCTGNLKQLGSAVQMYLSDNKEYFLPQYIRNPFESSAINTQASHFGLFPYTGNAARMDKDFQSSSTESFHLSKSLPKVFLCPSTNYDICTKWKSMSSHPGYSIPKGLEGQSIRKIRKPSRSTCMFDNASGTPIEKELVSNTHWDNNGTSSAVRLENVVNPAIPGIYNMKHQNQCNNLFLGGNVQPLNLSTMHVSRDREPWGFLLVTSSPLTFKLVDSPLINKNF